MFGRSRKNKRALAGEQAAPSYTPRIALRSIDGHVTRTANTVYAWYRLAPQRWSFRSDAERNDLINAIAGQYGELQGRWLHLRVTSRPFPIRDWAIAHTRNSRDRLPDVPGAQTFDEYLVGEQLALQGRFVADKEAYLGVEVQSRTLLDRATEAATPVLQKLMPDAVDAELRAVAEEVAQLNQILGRSGLEARPATTEEMWWLVHRSCTLGLPAPAQVPGVGEGEWAVEDLAAFDEAADWDQGPYDPTVTVHGRGGSHADSSREVCVLTVGVCQRMRIPEEDDPWVQRADRAGAVEWSARIYVRRPEEVQGELQRQMGKVKSQVRHYTEEHDIDPPQALDRQAARARAIDDEMATGFDTASTRVRSWWRLAVSAPTRREALKRAQGMVDLYKPQVAIEHPEAQHALAREFIPGEPLASRAYQRRASVRWVASGMPHATAEVGDRRGVLLGETRTATRRPVAWDPWMAQEVRDGSGLTAIAAGLGGGKSFLGGTVVYKTLRSGAHWVVLDPSGPLARLCRLPELAPYARVIDLLNAQPGILNPYRVVPEPVEADFADEPNPQTAWMQEVSRAQAQRRQLVRDVLLGLLPHSLAQQATTQKVLLRAIRTVGGQPEAHPGMVIDQLKRDRTSDAEHAHAIHDHLDELREQMQLLIPRSGEDPYSIGRDDRLTVLTMTGLTLPKEGVGPEHWTSQEALGMQLLNLAAWLTQRIVYEGPASGRDGWVSARKGVWIDEAFFLSSTPTGRVLMNRFARDSRKWNVRVLLSSQIPADFLAIPGFASLVDSVFVGRLDDEEAQADALRLLKVTQGAGYEQALGRLSRRSKELAEGQQDTSPRQFVFSDGSGGIERISVDVSGEHLAGLREALYTTPSKHTEARAADFASSDLLLSDDTAFGAQPAGPPQESVDPDAATRMRLQFPSSDPDTGDTAPPGGDEPTTRTPMAYLNRRDGGQGPA